MAEEDTKVLPCQRQHHHHENHFQEEFTRIRVDLCVTDRGHVTLSLRGIDEDDEDDDNVGSRATAAPPPTKEASETEAVKNNAAGQRCGDNDHAKRQLINNGTAHSRSYVATATAATLSSTQGTDTGAEKEKTFSTASPPTLSTDTPASTAAAFAATASWIDLQVNEQGMVDVAWIGSAKSLSTEGEEKEQQLQSMPTKHHQGPAAAAATAMSHREATSRRFAAQVITKAAKRFLRQRSGDDNKEHNIDDVQRQQQPVQENNQPATNKGVTRVVPQPQRSAKTGKDEEDCELATTETEVQTMLAGRRRGGTTLAEDLCDLDRLLSEADASEPMLPGPPKAIVVSWDKLVKESSQGRLAAQTVVAEAASTTRVLKQQQKSNGGTLQQSKKMENDTQPRKDDRHKAKHVSDGISRDHALPSDSDVGFRELHCSFREFAQFYASAARTELEAVRKVHEVRMAFHADLRRTHAELRPWLSVGVNASPFADAGADADTLTAKSSSAVRAVWTNRMTWKSMRGGDAFLGNTTSSSSSSSSSSSRRRRHRQRIHENRRTVNASSGAHSVAALASRLRVSSSRGGESASTMPIREGLSSLPASFGVYKTLVAQLLRNPYLLVALASRLHMAAAPTSKCVSTAAAVALVSVQATRERDAESLADTLCFWVFSGVGTQFDFMAMRHALTALQSADYRLAVLQQHNLRREEQDQETGTSSHHAQTWPAKDISSVALACQGDDGGIPASQGSKPSQQVHGNRDSNDDDSMDQEDSDELDSLVGVGLLTLRLLLRRFGTSFVCSMFRRPFLFLLDRIDLDVPLDVFFEAIDTPLSPTVGSPSGRTASQLHFGDNIGVGKDFSSRDARGDSHKGAAATPPTADTKRSVSASLPGEESKAVAGAAAQYSSSHTASRGATSKSKDVTAADDQSSKSVAGVVDMVKEKEPAWKESFNDLRRRFRKSVFKTSDEPSDGNQEHSQAIDGHGQTLQKDERGASLEDTKESPGSSKLANDKGGVSNRSVRDYSSPMKRLAEKSAAHVRSTSSSSLLDIVRPRSSSGGKDSVNSGTGLLQPAVVLRDRDAVARKVSVSLASSPLMPPGVRSSPNDFVKSPVLRDRLRILRQRHAMRDLLTSLFGSLCGICDVFIDASLAGTREWPWRVLVLIGDAILARVNPEVSMYGHFVSDVCSQNAAMGHNNGNDDDIADVNESGRVRDKKIAGLVSKLVYQQLVFPALALPAHSGICSDVSMLARERRNLTAILLIIRSVFDCSVDGSMFSKSSPWSVFNPYILSKAKHVKRHLLLLGELALSASRVPSEEWFGTHADAEGRRMRNKESMFRLVERDQAQLDLPVIETVGMSLATMFSLRHACLLPPLCATLAFTDPSMIKAEKQLTELAKSLPSQADYVRKVGSGALSSSLKTHFVFQIPAWDRESRVLRLPFYSTVAGSMAAVGEAYQRDDACGVRGREERGSAVDVISLPRARRDGCIFVNSERWLQTVMEHHAGDILHEQASKSNVKVSTKVISDLASFLLSVSVDISSGFSPRSADLYDFLSYVAVRLKVVMSESRFHSSYPGAALMDGFLGRADASIAKTATMRHAAGAWLFACLKLQDAIKRVGTCGCSSGGSRALGQSDIDPPRRVRDRANSFRFPVQTAGAPATRRASVTLRSVLAHPNYRAAFRLFCEKQFCTENLDFLEAVEEFTVLAKEVYRLKEQREKAATEFPTKKTTSWRGTRSHTVCDAVAGMDDDGDQLSALRLAAKSIFTTYIANSADAQVTLGCRMREILENHMEALEEGLAVPVDLFKPAGDTVFTVLKNDVFMRFLQSPQYKVVRQGEGCMELPDAIISTANAKSVSGSVLRASWMPYLKVNDYSVPQPNVDSSVTQGRRGAACIEESSCSCEPKSHHDSHWLGDEASVAIMLSKLIARMKTSFDWVSAQRLCRLQCKVREFERARSLLLTELSHARLLTFNRRVLSYMVTGTIRCRLQLPKNLIRESRVVSPVKQGGRAGWSGMKSTGPRRSSSERLSRREGAAQNGANSSASSSVTTGATDAGTGNPVFSADSVATFIREFQDCAESMSATSDALESRPLGARVLGLFLKIAQTAMVESGNFLSLETVRAIEIMEAYICFRLHRIFFPVLPGRLFKSNVTGSGPGHEEPLGFVAALEHAFILNVSRLRKWVTPTSLGLPAVLHIRPESSRSWRWWDMPLAALGGLCVERNPRGLISCLVSCIKAIADGVTALLGSASYDADVALSALVYVMLRAPLSYRIVSNVYFCDAFASDLLDVLRLSSVKDDRDARASGGSGVRVGGGKSGALMAGTHGAGSGRPVGTGGAVSSEYGSSAEASTRTMREQIVELNGERAYCVTQFKLAIRFIAEGGGSTLRPPTPGTTPHMGPVGTDPEASLNGECGIPPLLSIAEVSKEKHDPGAMAQNVLLWLLRGHTASPTIPDSDDDGAAVWKAARLDAYPGSPRVQIWSYLSPPEWFAALPRVNSSMRLALRRHAYLSSLLSASPPPPKATTAARLEATASLSEQRLPVDSMNRRNESNLKHVRHVTPPVLSARLPVTPSRDPLSSALHANGGPVETVPSRSNMSHDEFASLVEIPVRVKSPQQLLEEAERETLDECSISPAGARGATQETKGQESAAVVSTHPRVDRLTKEITAVDMQAAAAVRGESQGGSINDSSDEFSARAILSDIAHQVSLVQFATKHKHNANDILFFLGVNKYRKLRNQSEKQHLTAQHLYDLHVAIGGANTIALPSAVRKGVYDVLRSKLVSGGDAASDSVPSALTNGVFDKACDVVMQRMECMLIPAYRKHLQDNWSVNAVDPVFAEKL